MSQRNINDNRQNIENVRTFYNIIPPLHWFGDYGFTQTAHSGAVWYTPNSDTNAGILARFYLKQGTYKFHMVFHNNTASTTASGVLNIGSNPLGSSRNLTNLINAANFDLVNTSAEVWYEEVSESFVISGDHIVGAQWGKDDNSGGAANNLYVDMIFMVRQ